MSAAPLSVMAQSALDRELTRLKRNTAAKLARLRKREGFSANVIRALDPRSTGVQGTLSPAQKRTLIATLKQFNHRSTTFYADADRQPISRSVFDDYKRAESKFNASILADIKHYAHVPLPDAAKLTNGKVMTLLEYAEYRPNYVKLRRNPGGSGMFKVQHDPVNLNAMNLENYINWLHRKATKEYRAEKIQSAWRSIRGMSKNNPELFNLLEGLTDKQVEILMNYTRFSDYLKDFYLFTDASSNDKRWADKLTENARGMVEEHVEWAKQYIV